MDGLNYHHLRYFWVVAREGSVTRACDVLGLSQPTISGQIRELEARLGTPLFTRTGRGLVLTDAGRLAVEYADRIFALGRELVESAGGRLVARRTRLRVGVADGVPGPVAHRLLGPALRLSDPVRLVCTGGTSDRLMADLCVHKLDLVLSDIPVPAAVRSGASGHRLGGCGVAVVGVPELADRYAPGFPQSLDGAPFLLPAEHTSLRRSLDRWMAASGIRPAVRGELTDGALLTAFGRAGAGLFAVPTAAEPDIRRQCGVRRVGLVPGLRERFYAVSAGPMAGHPAVAAVVARAGARPDRATTKLDPAPLRSDPQRPGWR